MYTIIYSRIQNQYFLQLIYGVKWWNCELRQRRRNEEWGTQAKKMKWWNGELRQRRWSKLLKSQVEAAAFWNKGCNVLKVEKTLEIERVFICLKVEKNNTCHPALSGPIRSSPKLSEFRPDRTVTRIWNFLRTGNWTWCFRSELVPVQVQQVQVWTACPV